MIHSKICPECGGNAMEFVRPELVGTPPDIEGDNGRYYFKCTKCGLNDHNMGLFKAAVGDWK